MSAGLTATHITLRGAGCGSWEDGSWEDGAGWVVGGLCWVVGGFCCEGCELRDGCELWAGWPC